MTVYLVGNWKMHMTIHEATHFIEALIPHLKGSVVHLAVPFTAIRAAKEAAEGTHIAIGSQNVSEHSHGAYTGEISVEMVKEAGATFTLVGHSERRHLYNERNEIIAAKLERALQWGLKVILCIGETEKEREQGKTDQVLDIQLNSALASIKHPSSLLIAYEPVWAIGTGKTATPEMAQKAHEKCRGVLSSKWNEQIAKSVPLLYGGSVTPETLEDLLKQKDIDGVLVGGASLDVKKFSQMVEKSRRL